MKIMCQSAQVQLAISEEMQFEEFEREICKQQQYSHIHFTVLSATHCISPEKI